MKIEQGTKESKLLQYGERVWGILDGTDGERINQTIGKTVAFFESLGVQTSYPGLLCLDLETVNAITDRFRKRGYKLGEKGILSGRNSDDFRRPVVINL